MEAIFIGVTALLLAIGVVRATIRVISNKQAGSEGAETRILRFAATVISTPFELINTVVFAGIATLLLVAEGLIMLSSYAKGERS